MDKNFYKTALEAIKPLKLMEFAIEDMMQKDKDNPELMPKYYELLCGMITILEQLKGEMREYMNES